MSEENTQDQNKNIDAADNSATATSNEVQLGGVYAFKMGMSSVYSDDGSSIPVTVLKYKPWFVSQLKTEATDGYDSVQIACDPKKATRTSAAEKKHLSGAGFENGAYFVREIRGNAPEGTKVGQKVAIESLTKGDKVTMVGYSKGHGFSGVVKRHGFAGGPATHGSGFHRRPGSIGNCEEPGRVMAGKKMPGQFGNHRNNRRNVQIVDVITEDSVILIKGSVPGSRNSLIRLMKV
jgi:large subunit ribosomal protein L3